MVKLFYKEFELGSLDYNRETKEYIYNSNLEGEKKAKQKYLSIEFYSLSNSINKTSKTIFVEFDIFKRAILRADIVELANIKTEDDVFTRLEKVALLDIGKDGYYIKSSE